VPGPAERAVGRPDAWPCLTTSTHPGLLGSRPRAHSRHHAGQLGQAWLAEGADMRAGPHPSWTTWCGADLPRGATRALSIWTPAGQRTHRRHASHPDPAARAQAGHAAAVRAASLGGRPAPLERPHSGSGLAGSYGGMPTRFTVTTGETFSLPPPPCAPGPSPPAAASVQVRGCMRAGPAAAAERGGMLRSRCVCGWDGWGCLCRERAGLPCSLHTRVG